MTATDLRALGRLGQTNGTSGVRRRRRLATRAVRGVPAATPRRRLPRSLLVVFASLLAVLAYLGVTANQQTDTGQALASLPLLPDPGGDTAPVGDLSGGRHGDTGERASRSGGAPSADGSITQLADVDGLVLELPHADPVAVAFHEASLAEALELTPIGRLEVNDNPTKFGSGLAAQGPSYRVLSSRGRPRPATSAVDVVVPQGATVTAPVGGTVVEARRYALYGSTRDWRVVIEPHERPDLQVVIIHLHRPAVEPGDEVLGGRTPLGVARQLPFTSQVDYVVGESNPHIHIEVKAATTPKPADPNAPAVEPDDALDVSSG